jgi:hypothetical protein
MNGNNDLVRVAAITWTRAAMQFIHAQTGFTRSQTDTWIRADDNTFERVTWERIIYRPAIVAQALWLPEFRALTAAVARDAELSPLFNRFVGIDRGYGVVFNAGKLSSLFLPVDTDPRNPRHALQYTDGEFESRYDELRRFARTDRLSQIYVYPLLNFQSPTPIELAPDLTIRRMTDDEIAQALSWGLLPTDLNQYRRHESEPSSCFSVVRRFEEPRVSLAQQPPIRNGGGPFADDRNLIEACMGIATIGDVRVCSTMNYCASGWPYATRAVFQPSTVSDTFGPIRLAQVTAEEVPFFAATWRALASAWPGYTLAARRFYQASMRENPVDSLLDEMIAAEAVLLPNMKDELSYRIASNAAHYLAGDEPAARRGIFDLYKEAYNARSTIAHGGDPANLEVRLGQVRVGLRQFEPAFRDSLQRMLRLMVERDECGAAINWVDQVIGARAGR